MSFPRRVRNEGRTSGARKPAQRSHPQRTPVYRQTHRGGSSGRGGRSHTAELNVRGNQRGTSELNVRGNQRGNLTDRDATEDRSRRQDEAVSSNDIDEDATGNTPEILLSPEELEKVLLEKENKELVQQLNCFLKEVEGFGGSEDISVLQKQCATTVQHFKFARESLVQQLAPDTKALNRFETITGLIRQITNKFQKQREEFDKLKTAQGKHLVHCKQIRVEKMEAQFQAQLQAKCSKLDEEKKKLILEKFTLTDEVKELEREKREINEKFHSKEKSWNEERNNLEKALRQKSQELSGVERDLNKKNVEHDRATVSFKIQMNNMEVKLENALKDKRVIDRENEELRVKFKDFSDGEAALITSRRERDQLRIKVDDLEKGSSMLEKEKEKVVGMYEETKRELDDAIQEKEKAEEEILKLKGDLKTKRVTIKLPLKESSAQTDVKWEELLKEVSSASSLLNPDGKSLVQHEESSHDVSRDSSSAGSKKTSSTNRKFQKGKIYTRSHINITKAKDNSDEETEPKVQIVHSTDLDEIRSDGSMTYTMRGKFQPREKSAYLRSESTRHSYTMDKFLTDQHLSDITAKKAETLEMKRQASTLSTDSQTSDLSAASTKVHRQNSGVSDNTEISSADSESGRSFVYARSFKPGFRMPRNQRQNELQGSTTIVCKNYITMGSVDKVKVDVDPNS